VLVWGAGGLGIGAIAAGTGFRSIAPRWGAIGAGIRSGAGGIGNGDCDFSVGGVACALGGAAMVTGATVGFRRSGSGGR
jgi:hypothetical protein